MSDIEILNERQAIVADDELETLVLLDRTTGQRNLLPNNAIGTGPRFNAPRFMTSDGVRAFVNTNQASQLFGVELASGDRQLLIDDEQFNLRWEATQAAIERRKSDD